MIIMKSNYNKFDQHSIMNEKQHISNQLKDAVLFNSPVYKFLIGQLCLACTCKFMLTWCERVAPCHKSHPQLSVLSMCRC